MNGSSRHTQPHIDSIARQEQAFLEQRTLLERAGNQVAGFAGSIFFVMIHGLILFTWMVLNNGAVHWMRPFDPYPFQLLAMIVAVEAVVLSSFILMRQNRMTKRAERRDHLNLQVDLIAEKEITKLLQMVQAICGQMGLTYFVEDRELKDFSQQTSVETLTQRIEDTLPK
jgi:uncharacterized membrane protein